MTGRPPVCGVPGRRYACEAGPGTNDVSKLTGQTGSARRGRIGPAAALVLLFGIGATALIVAVAHSNVHDSERSLVHERTSQTFGVIQTVVQQVEAITAAGAAAARYTNGDPAAFKAAVADRVETSLVSNLSLLRLRGGHVQVLATVGRTPPRLLDRLTPAEIRKLHEIARTGADLTYVSRASFAGGRIVSFGMSPRAGSDLVIYGEITATDAEAQAGGVAPSDQRFAIYLGGKATPATLLLSSPDGVPRNGVMDRIPIGNEELIATLSQRHRLVGTLTWWAPWQILAIGLIGSLALAAFVESGRRRRDEALRLVAVLEQRTEELDRALSEQQRAEHEARIAAEKLRHAQRMEAIGRLAGGVAHDFNNLLTAIIGSTRLLLRTTPREDPSRRGLEDVERAADRAASLTRQLLAFSRKQVLQPTVVDLNWIVEETRTMLRHLIRADIRFVTSLEPRLAPVEADARQLEQVLINLVVNASDAIPGGGTIAISTANVTSEGDELLPEGRYAMLGVTDDGIGMDEETRDRIFEPFFTTKELGRGTGLGLATVYGIVEQSGGSIEVESDPGHGTVFRVFLPAVDKKVPEPHPVCVVSGPSEGTETVVVAEDDDMVRALVRVTLEGSGYRVLEAASGEAALELCDAHPEPIDVLVTDMVMPGIGGRALAARLQARRPELRVLYVSGYAESEVFDDGDVEAESSFVQKPFTPEELALKVRALIDRPRPRTGPAESAAVGENEPS